MTASKDFITPTFWRIFIFLGLIGAGVALSAEAIYGAFKNNLVLNSVIAATFLGGVCFSLMNLFRLRHETTWLKGMIRGEESSDSPLWVAPFAHKILALRYSGRRLSITDGATLMHTLEQRLSDAREWPRYIIGMLIFLGLLGTFWGLSQTIRSVANVISNLSTQGNDALISFETLKEGLRTPLSGMGTAFSCSMFGLAGSLILGFIELQVGRAFARFLHMVEEWLQGQEDMSMPKSQASVESPDYTLKILELMADNLETVVEQQTRNGDKNKQFENFMGNLLEKMTVVSEHIKAQHTHIAKLTEHHLLLQKWLHQTETSAEDTSRHHLRNIEALLARMNQDRHDNLTRLTEELRKEFRLLAKMMPQERSRTPTTSIKAL